MNDVKDLIARSYGWHVYYAHKLIAFGEASRIRDAAALRIPQMQVFPGASRWAGRYYRAAHRCVYPLPYMALGADAYEETVAHELCHAFQHQLAGKPTKWHGEFFHFLMHDVCGFKQHHGRHDFSVMKAKKLGEIFTFHETLIREVLKSVQTKMPHLEAGVELPLRTRKARRNVARDKKA